MQSSQQLVKNFKSYKNSDIQIAYGNEKLETILSQVNAPEN